MITIICSIIAFSIGAVAGLVLTCCCVVAGKADDAAEYNTMQEACKAPEE